MGSRVAFDLWREPWIPVVRPDGEIEEAGLRGVLARAHALVSLHETAPPLAAGMHRLLAAVGQACYRQRGAPLTPADLAGILGAGQFDLQLLDQFGDLYGQRFDLFSPDAPFLQTADVPLTPRKQDHPISVGYLLPDEPTGTNVVHFRHRFESGHRFCPSCAARGLAALPAFATSGGRGFRPSINGAPPLYVLPVGRTLFESLAHSLITEPFLPDAAAPDEEDQPWWERDPVIPAGEEREQVGYLESLTYPARRVRLFPEVAASRGPTHCTRCGRTASMMVRQMHFTMGLSRPRDAAPWCDPFAAYRVREQRPVPVRPVEGKPLWREYSTLFVTQRGLPQRVAPPRVVAQLAVLEGERASGLRERFAFRCIGLRTDMKAKVFEWDDVTLEIPAGFLNDAAAQLRLVGALEAAEEANWHLGTVFATWLAAPRPGEAAGRARKRHDDLRRRMRDTYWQQLAGPFRETVLRLADAAQREAAYQAWLRRVRETGRAVLAETAAGTGQAADGLYRSVMAVDECRRRLSAAIRKHGYEPAPLSDDSGPAGAAHAASKEGAPA